MDCAGAIARDELDDLNTRQRKFVLGLVAGKSQAQAYRDAGYASSTPEVNASRLLRNAKVRSAFQELAVATQHGAIADAVERQAFWTSVMRDRGADMRDRLKASELLGRAGGDFIERIQTDSSIRVEFALDPLIATGGEYVPPNPYAGVIGLPAPGWSEDSGS
jgi:phage terminase small subunit